MSDIGYNNRKRLVKSLREIRDGLNEYCQFISTKGLTGWPITAATKRLNDIADQIEADKAITG